MLISAKVSKDIEGKSLDDKDGGIINIYENNH